MAYTGRLVTRRQATSSPRVVSIATGTGSFTLSPASASTSSS